jgi:hypothetical protein
VVSWLSGFIKNQNMESLVGIKQWYVNGVLVREERTNQTSEKQKPVSPKQAEANE